MEESRSSEMSVLTRPPQRNIPEDGISHSGRCEYLKSYKGLNLRKFNESKLKVESKQNDLFEVGDRGNSLKQELSW
jgi:hypothetical protein